MQDPAVLKSIALACAGDEQALAALITGYMPQIRGAAGRGACPGLDYEDAVQEGMIGLFHAMESYDAAKEASFSTYAEVCIRNAVTSAVRAATRQKHAVLNTSVPLTEMNEAAAANTPEEVLLANEEYESAVSSINTRLSHLEKQVLGAFLDGKSYTVIAKQLSITEKAVDNALQRVRTKLK